LYDTRVFLQQLFLSIQLARNVSSHKHREVILSHFARVVKPKPRSSTSCEPSLSTVRRIQGLFPNAAFVPIDHNERQCAVLCKRRLFDELKAMFYDDRVHFRHIVPGSVVCGVTIGEDVEADVLKFVADRRNPEWFKHSWSGKLERLAYLYLTVKDDGLRFRPIGSASPLAHKSMLSHVSTAICAILRFSGLRHHTYDDTFDLKDDIDGLNAFAHANGLFVHMKTWDIKNFYTEILKHVLLESYFNISIQRSSNRMEFILSYYAQHNGSPFISIPKYTKRFKLKPRPGFVNSSAYYTLHIDMILDVIRFALETAFFKLGTVILLQIVGLVMGDPLSPNLAQCFVAFDEHHHSLINWSINSNIVRVFQKCFMDDVIAVILTSSPVESDVCAFFEFVRKCFYEHDQVQKRLELKASKDGDKYLDADVLVSADRRSIKLVYHNKNANIQLTHEQDTGRFLHKNSLASTPLKVQSVANVLARAHRFTSLESDLGPIIHQVFAECLVLGFDVTMFVGVVTAAIRMLKKSGACVLYELCLADLRKR
jgi:hypothetical protein